LSKERELGYEAKQWRTFTNKVYLMNDDFSRFFAVREIKAGSIDTIKIERL
jgi:hypothetical protein